MSTGSHAFFGQASKALGLGCATVLALGLIGLAAMAGLGLIGAGGRDSDTERRRTADPETVEQARGDHSVLEREQPANFAQPRSNRMLMPAQTPSQVLEPVRPGIRDVTPPSVHRPPPPETVLIERLPAKIPEIPPEAPEPESWMIDDVPQAGLLVSGQSVIRIDGIVGLAREATCALDSQSAAARRWPCGQFARTALQRLIRRRAVNCVSGANADAEDDGVAAARCTVGGHDLGLWLVRLGWAQATSADYREAETEARRLKRGQWGGKPR